MIRKVKLGGVHNGILLEQEAKDIMDAGGFILVSLKDVSENTVFFKDSNTQEYKGLNMYYLSSRKSPVHLKEGQAVPNTENIRNYLESDTEHNQVMAPNGWWNYFKKSSIINTIKEVLVTYPDGYKCPSKKLLSALLEI